MQLSGGQRQRVALARAIVNHPQVLLLDEPLGALDLKLRQEMQSELKRIQQEVGITFVYVTHDQEEALTMSDRIAVFSQGRIDQIGSPAGRLRAAGERVRRRVRRHLEPARPRRAAVHDPSREDQAAADGERPTRRHVERGTIREVVYAGMVTRYVVDLDAGRRGRRRQPERLGPAPARTATGKPATVAWRPGRTPLQSKAGGGGRDEESQAPLRRARARGGRARGSRGRHDEGRRERREAEHDRVGGLPRREVGEAVRAADRLQGAARSTPARRTRWSR